MKLSHTDYLETLLALSRILDTMAQTPLGPIQGTRLLRAQDLVDKVLSHHFDTKETEQMKAEDIAADGGGK